MELKYLIEEKMCEPRQLLEDEIVEKIILEKIVMAVNMLTDHERIIINELFFNGKSEIELADLMKIPRTTLEYKKNKIINKLKKITGK